MDVGTTRAPRGDAVVVGDDEIRLLRDGVVAHAAMLDAIREATSEVLLEMYWIGDDHVGRAFRAALVERARAGVVVRVIHDAVGSFELPASFWSALIAAGGSVRAFSPLSPLELGFSLRRIHLRDHRKNLVVDEHVGFAGGINLGAEWAPLSGTPWRDDAVEVRGPTARAIRVAFYRVWQSLGQPTPPGATEVVASLVNPRVHVLTNEIRERPNRLIRRTYLYGIRAARESICITNAYFLPGSVLVHALCRAAKRGVRVRVLLPHETDVRLVKLATEAILEPLLAAGVEMYAFTGRILHAKTAVIDDRVAIVGSHNLDAYSWRFNLECNVVIDDETVAVRLRQGFDVDCATARRIDRGQWARRSRWSRLAARGAALLRPIL